MSLPYSTSRALFEGNGVAVRFPFPFKVWNASQLRLVVANPMGFAEVVQPESVELAASGGAVTYRQKGEPLPAGWKLVVLRNMPFTQGVDLISGTRFDPQVIEDQMDQATAERQQLLEEVARAIKVPASSDNPPELLADMIFEARDEAVASAGHAEASAKRSEAQVARAGAEADRAKAEADSLKELEIDVQPAPQGQPSTGDYDPATGVLTLCIPEGPTGAQGPQGAEGPQGLMGAMGLQGPRGIQGVQGLQGDRGPEGQQGNMGPQGDQGPRGEHGEIGPEGVQGEQGIIGETGAQGPRGEQGVIGPEGPIGIQGEMGERGPQGVEGPQGAIGDKGPLGDSPLPLTFGNMRVNALGYLEFEYNGGPLDANMFNINPITGDMEVHL